MIDLPDELTRRDSEISRCTSCDAWRYRSTYLPCQTCGAPSVAEIVAPPLSLTEDQIDARWRQVIKTWTGYVMPARVRAQDEPCPCDRHARRRRNRDHEVAA